MLGVVLVVLCLGFVAATVCLFFCLQKRSNLPRDSDGSKHLSVMLVIAHPDDECMFFGPILSYLQNRTRCRVSCLCLTNGNANGLGKVREKELLKSLAKLGISDLELIDDGELKDSMVIPWSISRAEFHVKEAVKKFNADLIVTFDEFGVSRHINHTACSHCVESIPIPTLKLVTVPLAIKYIGPIAAFFYIGREYTFVSGGAVARAAMREHRSQYVWFRRLFVIFSSYMYINTFLLYTPQRLEDQK